MRSPRKRLLGAMAVATGALALAAPVSGASAAVLPTALPLPTAGLPIPAALPTLPVGGLGGLGGINALGGSTNGTAGCVGTNRPSVGGNNGSTSAQTCGAVLSFSGPQIGQIAAVIGPTIIGSQVAQVVVSAGSPIVTP
jgi:hypothetical protein